MKSTVQQNNDTELVVLKPCKTPAPEENKQEEEAEIVVSTDSVVQMVEEDAAQIVSQHPSYCVMGS